MKSSQPGSRPADRPARRSGLTAAPTQPSTQLRSAGRKEDHRKPAQVTVSSIPGPITLAGAADLIPAVSSFQCRAHWPLLFTSNGVMCWENRAANVAGMAAPAAQAPFCRDRGTGQALPRALVRRAPRCQAAEDGTELKVLTRHKLQTGWPRDVLLIIDGSHVVGQTGSLKSRRLNHPETSRCCYGCPGQPPSPPLAPAVPIPRP
jgi:hypothetical protein